MRLFALLSLAGIALAQNSTTSATPGSTSSSTSAASTSAASTTLSANPSIVTVAQDGSGQFTAINAGISAAQVSGIPSVTILPGVYTEAINVLGTATVTVQGAQATSAVDWSQNQVTVVNPATVMQIVTNNILGVTWKYISFQVTGATAASKSVYAASVRGKNNAFYGCSFVSGGPTSFYSTLGFSFVANSYFEADSKTIAGYDDMYIYNSTVTLTSIANNGQYLLYQQGNGVGANSTVVFDSCTLTAKAGSTSTSVYLVAPNGDYSQAVWRNTYMGPFIYYAGLHPNAAKFVNVFYGEYQCSGPGSMAANVGKRSTVERLLGPSDMPNYTLDFVAANAFSPYGTTDLSFLDAGILAAIRSSDAAQDAAYSATASGTSPTVSSTSSSAAATSTTSSISASIVANTTSSSPVLSTSSSSIVVATNTTSASATSAVSPSSTAAACVLPSSIPPTAVVVGPSGSCAQYNTIQSAIMALPADSTTQYIYILAGIYTATSQTNISRAGATIFRGESVSPLDQTANQVVLQFSGGVLSSAGGSENVAVFRSTQGSSKGLTFYSINFVNTFPAQTNYQAIAMDIKSPQVGFYSCGFESSQSTLLTNTGSFYFSGCHISGTTDFLWVFGESYFYNTVIESTSTQTGLNIVAQQYTGTYALGSGAVFDHCSFVAGSSAVPQGYTYLARDYTTSARVAIFNSFFDAHISPAGFLIAKTPTNTTFIVGNNTGVALTALPASVQSVSSVPAGYALTDVFSSTSWIDQSAIAPFVGFAKSGYSVAPSTSTTSTSTSSTATGTSTTSAAAAATYTVGPAGSNYTYTSVGSAVAALPADSKPYTIYVLAGTYQEQFNITRYGKVTIIGETPLPNDYTQNLVTIQIAKGVLTSAGQDETTPVIGITKQNSDTSGVSLYNLNLYNTNPYVKNTAALAADFYGANIAAYGCRFQGFQDTLLANKGSQLFSNCYIEGSIDFIWGFSTAYFHQCTIATNTPGACVSAQSRAAGTVSGYVFDSCMVTYTSTYGNTYGLSYLGRPYNNYSTAVYMNSYIDQHISPLGWNVWSASNPQTNHVSFFEYNNTGPGAFQAGRASFATNITADVAAQYTLAAWLGPDLSWIDMTAYNYVPTYPLTKAGSTPVASAPGAVSTINAHPDSGTLAPNGSVIVDVTGATGSFTNLTAALASLPADSTNQTIFMMPGIYNEQVPTINRPGPVRLIGYVSAGAPGASYKDNTVTITFARGLSVSPLPVGHSDAETATIQTQSSTISWYNIIIINSDNLDGLEPSYVTLAASTYGSQVAFFACSLIGWQDTLLTGSTNGYQYFENSYIEGAIDFIWGYTAAYFKGCTIAGKKAKSAMTAMSRASTSAIGGYFFDQCLFTQASSITTDLSGTVYLGRPYSAYARVMIKYSYLDKIVNPSGWKVWSATDPRTDYITFVEYANSGPGNWENNTAARLAFGNATLATAEPFTLSSAMGGSTAWIDMTYFSSIATPQPAIVNITTPAPTNITVAGNSTYDGTTPPAGAYLVSQTGVTGSYGSIQAAINAAPTTSKTNVTIFIYPGTYSEQLVLNKSGTIIFRGYSEATADYTQNQVTITNNYGVDTAADQSNSDGATVYATGNYFYGYNIDFLNTAPTYAVLGFAVKSSKYSSLYSCSIVGGQDVLEINGYFFAFKSFIQGKVDMIWGGGQGYFLDSTITPSQDGLSLTADKRVNTAVPGGFVFDACRVQSPAGYKSIGLGRPYNLNSTVVYVDTYLDVSVIPAGWNIWSKSAPQTDNVIYGEYHNYGPGSDIGCRANFSEQLTDASVVPFQLGNFFTTTNFIDFSVIDTPPFVPGVGVPPSSTGCAVLPTSSLLPTSTSTLLNSTTPITSTTTVLKTTTEKVSYYTTATAGDVQSTVVLTQTSSAISTVFPPEVDSTTTIKASATYLTTIVAPDSTSISTVKSVYSSISTVTPDPVTKLTTQVLTSIVGGSTVYSTKTFTSVVTSSPDPITKTSIVKATATTAGSAVFDIESSTTVLTITADPVTKVSTESDLSTEIDTTSVPGPTSTLQATQTTFYTVTASARAASVVVSTTSTKIATKTISSKAATLSSSTQITVTAVDSTRTLAPSISTVYLTVVKTTTQKTTTSITCIPTANVAKRAWYDAAYAGPRLVRRAGGVSTETDYITVTSTIKTVATTLPGSVGYQTITSTLVISKTTTAKPSTVLFTTTAVAAKYSTITQPGNIILGTTTLVSELDSTTTLKASTTTQTVSQIVSSSSATTMTVQVTVGSTSIAKAGTTTLLSTSTSFVQIPQTSTITSVKTSTQTLNGGTTTSVQTVTGATTSLSTATGPVQYTTNMVTKQATTTVVNAGSVITVTSTIVQSSVQTITLAQSTITKLSTQTVTLPGNVATITPAPKITTKTSSVVSTVYSTVTKTAKGAKTCTA